MIVAFYKDDSRFLDWLIQWKTDGPYSHCEVVFRRLSGTSTFECASSSNRDSGVRFKDITMDESKWDFLYVPDINMEAVRIYFEVHKGEKYDYRGALSFVLPIGNNPRKKFCSEAIADALGIYYPQRFEPNSLYSLLKAIGGRPIKMSDIIE